MKVTISNNQLKIKLNLAENIFAVKGSFEIPIKNISKAKIEPASIFLTPFQRRLRVPGTSIPWLVRMGSYISPEGWEFLCVSRGQTVLVLELKDEHFKRICLGFNSESKAKDILKKLKVKVK